MSTDVNRGLDLTNLAGMETLSIVDAVARPIFDSW